MKSGIYTANTTSAALGENSLLPLGNIVRRSGCALDLNGNGINIFLPGCYKVTSSVTYTPTATGLLTVQLMADGVVVPGSVASTTAVAGSTYNLSLVGKVRRSCDSVSTLTIMVNLAGTLNNVALNVDEVEY